MRCYKHREREAFHSCSHCGESLCQECSFEVDGRQLCKDCIGNLLKSEPVKPKPSDWGTPPRRSGYSCRRHISWVPLLIFSFILPGLSYMFLGLIKRGLLTLSAFFLTIYFMVCFNVPLLGFAIVILWITTSFDAFHIRTKLNAGIPVEDSVSDIARFISQYKRQIMGGLILLLVISSVGNGGFFYRSFHSSDRNTFVASGIGWVVISLGIYFLIKGKGRKRKEGNPVEIIDKRNEE